DQGLKAPVYQYRNRETGEIFEFDLSELEDISRFPYRLQCEQYKMTRLLANLVNESGHGAVEFNRRVVAFEQDSNGVTVFVETPYDIERYRADYLIGADGANSIVRKWLGVEFEGFTYPEKFLCLSTDWPLEEHFQKLSYVNYVADPNEWVVLLRVPTLWRVLVPAENEDPDPYLTSDEKKNDIFDRLIGEDDAVRTEHRTIYKVHQRVAKRYVENRVLLVGDSAHLNNPLGGLGMNSGIHDAWNLCEKLVDILKNGADASELLPRYERQRRKVMLDFVQAQTINNKRSMESTNSEAREAYQREMQEILSDDERRRAYLLKQSMYQSLSDAAAIQ
ncbi:MAG: FAD-dependent monooxygenase, partial [Pseudomonadota bacterium]